MENRQLRPVYDALDIGDMKRALTECNRLLRRNPNHSSAKQGLTLTFRTLGMPKEEIEVYQAALKHDPGSERLNRNIFMAAARNHLYPTQYQAALQLSKQHKTDEYSWWVIASLLLQAKFPENTSQSSNQLQLTLAERMAEKALVDGRLQNTEQLRIYLEVLDLQGKHEKMLEIMTGSGGLSERIANDADLVTQRIELYIKNNDLKGAVAAATHSLEDCDNWIDYKHYIEATVLALKTETQQQAKVDAVNGILADIQRWGTVRGRNRNAALARVELALRLAAAGETAILESALGSLSKQMWAYVNEFQYKAICYADILSYFVAHVNMASTDNERLATIDAHRALLTPLLANAKDSASKSDSEAQAWVNYEKLSYLLQALSHESSAQQWTTSVVDMLKFGLDSDASAETWPACSDMVLLSAQRLIRSAFVAFPDDSEKRQSVVFKALAVLEAGIKQNKNPYHLKLYALRLYLYLSSYERAKAIHGLLNVKNIQHDTLGYMINGHGMALGCFMPDLELCYDGITFYDRGQSTIPREFETIYEKGTYSNLTDFIEFQDNLINSMQRVCTHRLALRGEVFEHGDLTELLSLWEEAHIEPLEKAPEMLKAMHDNRDTRVFPLLTPVDMPDANLEMLTRPLPLPQQDWVRANSLIPQIMHYIAMDDAVTLEIKTAELETILASDPQSLSPQDLVLNTGVCQLARLYIRASTSKDDFADQLNLVIATITESLPGDIDSTSSAENLGKLATALLRDLATSTELFSYALVVKYALASHLHSAAARNVAQALTALRKSALKQVYALRSWVDKNASEAVDECWMSPDEEFLADVTDFMCERRKSVVAVTTKQCVSGWLRSVKNMIGHWERRS
ncbi:mitochondrial distribution and morphology [Linderina macrospora]|uniref:Mitochondrial distribution and morphology n=1 Tax=Linderina macrospora TaxID=4868 RepID=A0ACC1JEF1_9FUNG|nr:mitochondrial distribution and morphology [Linderina macrospora]